MIFPNGQRKKMVAQSYGITDNNMIDIKDLNKTSNFEKKEENVGNDNDIGSLVFNFLVGLGYPPRR
jgi:hypothetical protein